MVDKKKHSDKVVQVLWAVGDNEVWVKGYLYVDDGGDIIWTPSRKGCEVWECPWQDIPYDCVRINPE